MTRAGSSGAAEIQKLAAALALELFDAGPKLVFRAIFELSRPFARHTEVLADVGERELVFGVGHQSLFDDEALALIQLGDRTPDGVAHPARGLSTGGDFVLAPLR